MKTTAYFLSLAFLLFMATQCTHALELSDLSIEYNHAVGTNRDWYLPTDSRRRGELNLNMRLTSLKYLYTDALIHSTIDESQFRHIGLDIESGVAYKRCEVYLKHHSQHVLDVDTPRDYPNTNSVGIRVKLFTK